jgi:hypothetical protein
MSTLRFDDTSRCPVGVCCVGFGVTDAELFPACTGAPDLCGASAGMPCTDPGCPSRASDDYPPGPLTGAGSGEGLSERSGILRSVTSVDALPTAEQIAVRAQELKVLHLGLMLSLSSLFDPDLPILQTELRRLGERPDGDFPVNLYYRAAEAEPECLSYSARNIFTAVSNLRGDVVKHDIMSISMINAGIRLGDMIRKGGHNRDDVPLLQFAYHFRNACGHGDVWNYSPSGPPHPASCRDLELTGELVGRRATWETVTPRLFVEFLDDITEHFAPGLVPPPSREA